MMSDSGTTSQGPVLRAAHLVLPWIALVAVVWVLASVWGSFQLAQQAARSAEMAAASSVATVTQPATATVVTGLAATALQDVRMRLQPDLSSAVVATAKLGSKLSVVAKQGLFLRVRDAAGHIGWVPNDVQYLQVTNTTTK